MSETIARKKGTTAEHSQYKGVDAEITVDTVKHTAVIQDGINNGGYPLAREDLSNINTQLLAEGRDGTCPFTPTPGTDATKNKNLAYADLSNVDSAGLETHLAKKDLTNLTADAANNANLMKRDTSNITAAVYNTDSFKLASKTMSNIDTADLAERGEDTPGYHKGKDLSYRNFSNVDTKDLAERGTSSVGFHTGKDLAYRDLSNVDLETILGGTNFVHDNLDNIKDYSYVSEATGSYSYVAASTGTDFEVGMTSEATIESQSTTDQLGVVYSTSNVSISQIFFDLGSLTPEETSELFPMPSYRIEFNDGTYIKAFENDIGYYAADDTLITQVMLAQSIVNDTLTLTDLEITEVQAQTYSRLLEERMDITYTSTRTVTLKVESKSPLKISVSPISGRFELTESNIPFDNTSSTVDVSSTLLGNFGGFLKSDLSNISMDLTNAMDSVITSKNVHSVGLCANNRLVTAGGMIEYLKNVDFGVATDVANLKTATGVGSSTPMTNYIIEEYSDGDNWYIIYKNGLCIQGGTSPGGRPVTVNFLVEINSLKYAGVSKRSGDINLGVTNASPWVMNNYTSTTMEIYSYRHTTSNVSADACRWIVIGYIN